MRPLNTKQYIIEKHERVEPTVRALSIQNHQPIRVLRERDKMCGTDHNPNSASPNKTPSANGNGTRRSSVSPDTVLNLEQ